MTIERIDDHPAHILELLLAQFERKPRIKAVLTAIAQEVQEVEDALLQVLDETVLSASVGAQLDGNAEIVNAQRLGLNDENFRNVIAATIQRNISQGEPERLIRIVELLIDGEIVLFQELFPGTVQIVVDTDFAPLFDANEFIDEAAAAGVRVEPITLAVTGGDAFAYDGDLGGKGYGSTLDPAAGGKYAAFA